MSKQIVTRVEARIVMPLTEEEIEEAEGDEAQAVQNAIGHTGAQVVCAGKDCD